MNPRVIILKLIAAEWACLNYCSFHKGQGLGFRISINLNRGNANVDPKRLIVLIIGVGGLTISYFTQPQHRL